MGIYILRLAPIIPWGDGRGLSVRTSPLRGCAKLVLGGAALSWLLLPSVVEAASSLSDDHQVLIVAGIVGVILYFLPFFIALMRGHAYTGVIFAINIFAGWTVLGWVALLVWSIWPSNRSLADPVLGNVTGTGHRNVGDTLGAISYGRQRGFFDESQGPTPRRAPTPGQRAIAAYQCAQCAVRLDGSPTYCPNCGVKIVYPEAAGAVMAIPVAPPRPDQQ